MTQHNFYKDRGFRVFPLLGNQKVPAIKNWPSFASRDPEIINTWFGKKGEHNLGILMGEYKEFSYCIAVDIDNKTEDCTGTQSLKALIAEGKQFPKTLTHKTPTGGYHLIYETSKQFGNVIGFREGIDIKGAHGYVVGAGSTIDGAEYTLAINQGVAMAPDWLEQELSTRKVVQLTTVEQKDEVDLPADDPYLLKLAQNYLKYAPVAIQGESGDLTTYKVAATLKNYGLTKAETFQVMQEWNARCEPPWSEQELRDKIHNAYKYAKYEDRAAIKVFIDDNSFAEDNFDAAKFNENLTLDQAVEYFNRRYAFLLDQGTHSIIFETRDVNGRSEVKMLQEASFHRKYAYLTVQTGEGRSMKQIPASQAWMNDRRCRRYEGYAFAPDKAPDILGHYNLWRGFAVTPLDEHEPPTEEQDATIKAMLHHIHANVCQGDDEKYHWFVNYFAHLIQFPHIKPRTSIVMMGKKGTGKTVVANWIGRLLGQHYLLSSEERYVTGNFNSYLKSCLLFCLDEAVWAGNKQAEGKLKTLITGEKMLIEYKHKEAFVVDSYVRLLFISNEDWVVPATGDERRFVVFNVAESRMQDLEFFDKIQRGLDRGADRLWMRFLLQWKVDTRLVDTPLRTKGLLSQIEQSFDTFRSFWYDSLHQGQWATPYPTGQIDGIQFTLAELQTWLRDYSNSRNIRSYNPSQMQLVNLLRDVAPSITKGIVEGENVLNDGARVRVTAYITPSLKELRDDFCKYIRMDIEWQN